MTKQEYNIAYRTAQNNLQKAIRTQNLINVHKYTLELEKLTEARYSTNVASATDSLSEEKKERLNNLCQRMCLCSDLVEDASIELLSIMREADGALELPISDKLKKIKQLSHEVVKLVDDRKNEEFSESFGELADRLKLIVDNFIYTDRAKIKREKEETK